MVRLRPVFLGVALGMTALMLTSCSTPSPAQIRQQRFEAAARAFTIAAANYTNHAPIVELPMTQVVWHRQWVANRSFWYHLNAAFWRWHLETRRVLGHRGDARQRQAETAYREAIGQWFGDQVNKPTIVYQCVGNGLVPEWRQSQKCWSTRRPLYQEKWIADDRKLSSAYAHMLLFNMSDFPRIFPNLCADTEPRCD